MSRAGTSIQVNVRRRHVTSGRRCSRLYCPVALALKEQFPKAKVFVQFDVIKIDDVPYKTPESAMQFMVRYDYSKDIAGINFKLPKMCPICKHSDHVKGKCNVQVETGTHRQHECACGKGC